MSYSKCFTRFCEYTPVVRVVDDGDGKRLEFREENDKEFNNRLCLSDDDIRALIQMLQEVLK